MPRAGAQSGRRSAWPCAVVAVLAAVLGAVMPLRSSRAPHGEERYGFLSASATALNGAGSTRVKVLSQVDVLCADDALAWHAERELGQRLHAAYGEGVQVSFVVLQRFATREQAERAREAESAAAEARSQEALGFHFTGLGGCRP